MLTSVIPLSWTVPHVAPVTFILLFFIAIIYYRYRIGYTKRIIAEQENTQLRLKQEKLQKEKQNIELECEKQTLTKENLCMRISQLESECESLKDLEVV